MRKNTKTVLSAGAFALVLLSLLVASMGGVTAATAEIANGTVTVDSDTKSVYAQLNGTNTTSDVNATVTFSGIDSNGNVTELEQRNVTVGAGNTSLVERTSIDSGNYSEYRIMVTADNTTNLTATTGKVQDVAAGGGGSGGFGGTGLSIGAVAALALVAIVVLGGRGE